MLLLERICAAVEDAMDDVMNSFIKKGQMQNYLKQKKLRPWPDLLEEFNVLGVWW